MCVKRDGTKKASLTPGERFSKLVFEQHADGDLGWFVCDCGTRFKANVYHVMSGETKSCGCNRDLRWMNERCYSSKANVTNKSTGIKNVYLNGDSYISVVTRKGVRYITQNFKTVEEAAVERDKIVGFLKSEDFDSLKNYKQRIV